MTGSSRARQLLEAAAAAALRTVRAHPVASAVAGACAGLALATLVLTLALGDHPDPGFYEAIIGLVTTTVGLFLAALAVLVDKHYKRLRLAGHVVLNRPGVIASAVATGLLTLLVIGVSFRELSPELGEGPAAGGGLLTAQRLVLVMTAVLLGLLAHLAWTVVRSCSPGQLAKALRRSVDREAEQAGLAGTDRAPDREHPEGADRAAGPAPVATLLARLEPLALAELEADDLDGFRCATDTIAHISCHPDMDTATREAAVAKLKHCYVRGARRRDFGVAALDAIERATAPPSADASGSKAGAARLEPLSREYEDLLDAFLSVERPSRQQLERLLRLAHRLLERDPDATSWRDRRDDDRLFQKFLALRLDRSAPRDVHRELDEWFPTVLTGSRHRPKIAMVVKFGLHAAQERDRGVGDAAAIDGQVPMASILGTTLGVLLERDDRTTLGMLPVTELLELACHPGVTETDDVFLDPLAKVLVRRLSSGTGADLRRELARLADEHRLSLDHVHRLASEVAIDGEVVPVELINPTGDPQEVVGWAERLSAVVARRADEVSAEDVPGTRAAFVTELRRQRCRLTKALESHEPSSSSAGVVGFALMEALARHARAGGHTGTSLLAPSGSPDRVDARLLGAFVGSVGSEGWRADDPGWLADTIGGCIPATGRMLQSAIDRLVPTREDGDPDGAPAVDPAVLLAALLLAVEHHLAVQAGGTPPPAGEDQDGADAPGDEPVARPSGAWLTSTTHGIGTLLGALNRAPGAWGAIAADGAVLDAAVSSLHALAASLAEQDVAPPRLEVVWELRDALEALRREDDLHSADATSDAESGDADEDDDEDERRDARRDADKLALLEEEEGGDHGDLVTDALTCLDAVEERAAANEGRRWLDSRRSARRRFTEALRRPEVASRWTEVLAPSFWEALEQTLEDQTSMPARVANGLAELPWSEGGSGATHDSEVRVRSRLVDWLSQCANPDFDDVARLLGAFGPGEGEQAERMVEHALALARGRGVASLKRLWLSIAEVAPPELIAAHATDMPGGLLREVVDRLDDGRRREYTDALAERIDECDDASRCASRRYVGHLRRRARSTSRRGGAPVDVDPRLAILAMGHLMRHHPEQYVPRALWRRALRSLHEVDAPTRGELAATAVTSLAEAAEVDLGLLTDAVVQLSSADPVRALRMVDELTERGRITSDERQRLWGRAARSAERPGTVAVCALVSRTNSDVAPARLDDWTDEDREEFRRQLGALIEATCVDDEHCTAVGRVKHAAHLVRKDDGPTELETSSVLFAVEHVLDAHPGVEVPPVLQRHLVQDRRTTSGAASAGALPVLLRMVTGGSGVDYGAVGVLANELAASDLPGAVALLTDTAASCTTTPQQVAFWSAVSERLDEPRLMANVAGLLSAGTLAERLSARDEAWRNRYWDELERSWERGCDTTSDDEPAAQVLRRSGGRLQAALKEPGKASADAGELELFLRAVRHHARRHGGARIPGDWKRVATGTLHALDGSTSLASCRALVSEIDRLARTRVRA